MKSIIMTVVRRVLVIVGTWLAGKGIITEGDWQTLVVGNIDVLAGAAMVVGSVVWSIIKNRKLEKAK